MKKNLLSMLIPVMALSLLCFFSCNKNTLEKNNKTKPDYNTLALTVGESHNAALDYYNNHAPFGTTMPSPLELSKTDFLQAMEILVDYAVNEEAAERTDVEADMADFVTFLENNGYFFANGGDDYLDILKMDNPMNMLGYMLSSTTISQTLYDEIETVNDMIENDENSEDILEYVNEIDVESYSGAERTALESFISVYNSSYEYWHGNPTYRLVLDKDDKIIIADAVGAMVGAIPLPIAAITVPLTAAACSIAKNHGWWSWF